MDEFDDYDVHGPTNVAFVTTRRRPGGMGFLPRAAKKAKKPPPKKKPAKKGTGKKAC